MILAKGTGVPNYVAHLYRKCLEIDPTNQYVFFQPNASRTLGVTQVARIPRGLLGAAWFDCLRVQRLIRRANVDVFHGPSHFSPAAEMRRRQIRGDHSRLVISGRARAVRLEAPLVLWLAIGAVIEDGGCHCGGFPGTPGGTWSVFTDCRRSKPCGLSSGGGTFSPGRRAAWGTPDCGQISFSVTTHPTRKNILGALAAFAMFAAQVRI